MLNYPLFKCVISQKGVITRIKALFMEPFGKGLIKHKDIITPYCNA